MSTPIPFPRMVAVRQKFPVSPPLDIPAAVQQEFKAQNVLSRLPPGARIAVAVGSRGITSIKNIVAEVLAVLKAAGAKPFIIPAMATNAAPQPQARIAGLKATAVPGKRRGCRTGARWKVSGF